MRGLLFLIALTALLSAEITVSASQVPGSFAVRYSVVQRDVNGGHLQLILRKDNVQLMVADVQNFNGVAGGFFSLQEEGTYRLSAYEETTGEYGEAEFGFVPPSTAAPPAKEGPGQIISGVPDYLFWLAFIVAAIIVFLLIFGNPLSQRPNK